MSTRTSTRVSKWASAVAILATIASVFIGVAPAQAAAETSASVAVPRAVETRAALSGADFNPGFIISDTNFYDRYAMTQTDIQTFLDTHVGACDNSNCLNIARTTSFSRPADAICAAYTGVANETTASIIFKVQTACGISAKVILVTLQKEQGLITNDGPSDSRLSRAMGYGCPDSSQGVCDAEYSGLYNQIYWAGRQFVRYGNPPGTSNYFTWYPVGSPVAVLYHPDSGRCGAAAVTIDPEQGHRGALLLHALPAERGSANALEPPLDRRLMLFLRQSQLLGLLQRLVRQPYSASGFSLRRDRSTCTCLTRTMCLMGTTPGPSNLYAMEALLLIGNDLELIVGFKNTKNICGKKCKFSTFIVMLYFLVFQWSKISI